MKKLSKRKIKRFLGQAVLYIGFNAIWVFITILGFMSMTVYR